MTEEEFMFKLLQGGLGKEDLSELIFRQYITVTPRNYNLSTYKVVRPLTFNGMWREKGDWIRDQT